MLWDGVILNEGTKTVEKNYLPLVTSSLNHVNHKGGSKQLERKTEPT